MTVYIDNAEIPATVGKFTSTWSHLMADTTEELVEFATQELGLKREWDSARG